MSVSSVFYRVATYPVRLAASAPVMLAAGTTCVTWDESEAVARTFNLVATSATIAARAFQLRRKQDERNLWILRTAATGITALSVAVKPILENIYLWPVEVLEKIGVALSITMANFSKLRMVKNSTETETNILKNPDFYTACSLASLSSQNPWLLLPVAAGILRCAFAPDNENKDIESKLNFLQKHVTPRRIFAATCAVLAIQKFSSQDYLDATGITMWLAGHILFEPIRNAALKTDAQKVWPTLSFKKS